jgi:hypothetical protein
MNRSNAENVRIKRDYFAYLKGPRPLVDQDDRDALRPDPSGTSGSIDQRFEQARDSRSDGVVSGA